MRRRSGQGTVEFALILPFLIMTLTGIIELSWVMFQTIALSHVTRQAAREGACGASDSTVVNRVRDSLGWLYRPNTAVVLTVFQTANTSLVVGSYSQTGTQTAVQSGFTYPRVRGSFLHLAVTYQLQFLTPLDRIFKNAEAATTVLAQTQYQCE